MSTCLLHSMPGFFSTVMYPVTHVMFHSPTHNTTKTVDQRGKDVQGGTYISISYIVRIVTCRLRATSAFHVTRTDPGTEAYEGLRNGLRVDLPVTFDAAPLDCAAEGVSAHLSSWRESKPTPRRRLRDLGVEVRLLDRLVDTLCSVEIDFNLLTLLVYLLYEYNVLSTILMCDAKKGLSTARNLGSGP